MTFGEQIKICRKKQNMTQEQLAARLDVSRQAVSHWEHGNNLPDLEIIVSISNIFDVSLDQLILGVEDRAVTTKLIQDRKQIRRMKTNLVGFVIGASFLLVGVGCIWIKANSVEYIDATGMLYESFFLIPISILSLLCGAVTFLIIGIKALLYRVKQKQSSKIKRGTQNEKKQS